MDWLRPRCSCKKIRVYTRKSVRYRFISETEGLRGAAYKNSESKRRIPSTTPWFVDYHFNWKSRLWIWFNLNRPSYGVETISLNTVHHIGRERVGQSFVGSYPFRVPDKISTFTSLKFAERIEPLHSLKGFRRDGIELGVIEWNKRGVLIKVDAFNLYRVSRRQSLISTFAIGRRESFCIRFHSDSQRNPLISFCFPLKTSDEPFE